MKNFFLSCCLLLALAAIPLLPSCATAGKNALNTEIISREAATVAWTTFRAARARHQVSDADWLLGVKAVDAFRAAGITTLDVVAQFKDHPDQSALQNSLTAYSKAWDTLYPLLARFTPSLSKTPPPP